MATRDPGPRRRHPGEGEPPIRDAWWPPSGTGDSFFAMRLSHLSLAGFRNLKDTELEFPPEGVALVGRNAQGKSNLLEAIHYLETFRSARGARDDQLVHMGGDVFRLGAELEGGERRRTVGAAFQSSTRSKKVTLDGEEVSRLADAIGSMGTVLFTPDDVRLVSDGPQERRRFLDIVLSLNEPGYLTALQRFRQTLSQRNAALRDRAVPASVRAWDDVLVRSGAAVFHARARWIEEFSPCFGRRYQQVSGAFSARLRYDCSVPGVSESGSVDEVAVAYRNALDASRRLEERRSTTLVGPHRDELTLLVDGASGERPLREFGSGGEKRTAALALRLVEAETLRSRRGIEPILLLDDVFAELDAERSVRVSDLMERLIQGQVVLTAPKESEIRFGGDTLDRWSVDAGEIRS